MSTAFERIVRQRHGAPLTAADVQTVQVNVGFRCNQQCTHCHLDAGPDRTEQMGEEVARQVVRTLSRFRRPTLDITGGAPELNPHLRTLVEGGRNAGCDVMIRTNLTALLQRRPLGEFLADRRVTVVASLPCYLRDNVESQRGARVYDRSIEALQWLNELGYGRDGMRELVLVHNPPGPSLPAGQADLEQDYRRHLRDEFGVEFDRLNTITNMPLGRFARELKGCGEFEEYMDTLRAAFNPATLDDLMCRHQVNVGPRGRLYDCDFNLALDWTVSEPDEPHIAEAEPGELVGRRIVTGRHCFGCTAGAGSSCRGTLAAT